MPDGPFPGGPVLLFLPELEPLALASRSLVGLALSADSESLALPLGAFFTGGGRIGTRRELTLAPAAGGALAVAGSAEALDERKALTNANSAVAATFSALSDAALMCAHMCSDSAAAMQTWAKKGASWGGGATVSITPDALLSNLKLVHCEQLVHQEKPQRRNMMDLEPEESNEPDARSSPAACDCIVVLAPMIVPPWLVAF